MVRIDKVKLSDAKLWMIKLQQKDGRHYSSIHNIRGVLRPAFQMAMDDDLIRKNPFQFHLGDVLYNDSEKRHALTPKQEEEFLRFVREDNHFSKYYDVIYILLNTGLRISEFCGLTPNEVDFKKHFFNHIVAKYNGIYKIQLPNITPHVCRHTFCSKMARKV